MTKTKITYPPFIDFEASSLHLNSYPIAVAWSLEDGHIESHLINPQSISNWTDWDEDAQAIHGLSREQLITEGQDPAWIADRMNDVLADKVLLTNACHYDLQWCETLFHAVDKYMYFNFDDAWQVMGQALQPHDQEHPSDELEKGKALYERMSKLSEQAWTRTQGQRHQADVDVRQLQKMWELIQGLED